MKEWKCVLVGHHDSVGKAIEEWEKTGWRLHTYTCTGNATITLGTNHYLLFMKGEQPAQLNGNIVTNCARNMDFSK